MFAKLVVIVDEEVDVHDQASVWSAVARHVDPGRDVFLEAGPPDPWDPAAGTGELVERMAIDATEKLPGEAGGSRPRHATVSDAIRRQVSDRWSEYRLGPDPSE